MLALAHLPALEAIDLTDCVDTQWPANVMGMLTRHTRAGGMSNHPQDIYTCAAQDDSQQQVEEFERPPAFAEQAMLYQLKIDDQVESASSVFRRDLVRDSLDGRLAFFDELRRYTLLQPTAHVSPEEDTS